MTLIALIPFVLSIIVVCFGQADWLPSVGVNPLSTGQMVFAWVVMIVYLVGFFIAATARSSSESNDGIPTRLKNGKVYSGPDTTDGVKPTKLGERPDSRIQPGGLMTYESNGWFSQKDGTWKNSKGDIGYYNERGDWIVNGRKR